MHLYDVEMGESARVHESYFTSPRIEYCARRYVSKYLIFQQFRIDWKLGNKRMARGAHNDYPDVFVCVWRNG